MAKTAKKEVVTGQVKYSDPRMAYMSTKSEMVLKESQTIKIKDIFGEEVLGKNNPIVVCEDQNGLYLTSKENVGVNILDPYRMYRRNQYVITKENEDFVITCKDKKYVA